MKNKEDVILDNTYFTEFPSSLSKSAAVQTHLETRLIATANPTLFCPVSFVSPVIETTIY